MLLTLLPIYWPTLTCFKSFVSLWSANAAKIPTKIIDYIDAVKLIFIACSIIYTRRSDRCSKIINSLDSLVPLKVWSTKVDKIRQKY